MDTCIVFKRRNHTAQYLSLKTAEKTDCWEGSPAEERGKPECAPERKVTEVGDDYDDFVAGKHEWFEEVYAACKAAGKPTKTVFMEDYLAL